jgi:hypothetical protein
MRVSDDYGLIWPSVELYREALRCFDAEAYHATCVMCRAAMEAVLYIAKTRDVHQIQLDPSRRLAQLIEWASEEGLLEGLEDKAKTIRDKGDLGAHLAQVHDKRYKKAREELETEIKKAGGELGLLIPVLAKPVSPWVKKEEARRIILDTCSIILQVTRKKWKVAHYLVNEL